MIFEFIYPAPEYTTFAPEYAGRYWLGQRVWIGAVPIGVITRAGVAEDGRSVRVTVDTERTSDGLPR